LPLLPRLLLPLLPLLPLLLNHTVIMADEGEEHNAGEEEEDEEDLEKLQAEIARMEEEAARISKETEELEQQKKGTSEQGGVAESNKVEGAAAKEDYTKSEACSVYVGQVDYSATPEELLQHFTACGTVERVTIVCDKYTGKPKGTRERERER
jgi:polyadenylate-binding protein 2